MPDVPATPPAPHLWEIDHPYYCAEGNYYKNGMHDVYDSWASFYEDWGDNDPDLNLVFRWDWKTHRIPGAPLVPGVDGYDRLLVFWVLQRKALLRSTECVVTDADEPAVLAWLQDRARTITAIWQPVTLTPAGGES
jgi:hypothetical protein